MRVRPSTLFLIGVGIIVVPVAPVVFFRSPTAWLALGGAFILAGIGTALHRNRRPRSARESSPQSQHFIICPYCATRNFASRDVCRYCDEEF
ncbi:hypothetical protein [Haladaptatus caseinilyticus]|uniref:hypothetical protein n=1 Tax=Haladaptatus caseinilyticus TaxID=2993314 RepID=UPI00224B7216|nr:hypothetical protein [Haladaptatus caseinilyticus]